MRESKEYLKKLVNLSLNVADEQSGSMQDFFVGQASRQQARLDQLIRSEPVKTKKKKK